MEWEEALRAARSFCGEHHDPDRCVITVLLAMIVERLDKLVSPVGGGKRDARRARGKGTKSRVLETVYSLIPSGSCKPFRMLSKEALGKGIATDELMRALRELMREGRIYEERQGCYRRVD